MQRRRNKRVEQADDLGHMAITNTDNLKKESQKPQVTGLTPNYREATAGDVRNPAGLPNEFLNLFEHDASEVILKQGLRHPFGALAIYITTGFVVLLIAGLLGIVLSNPQAILGMSISGSAGSVLALAGLAAVALVVIGGMLAAYVYGKSRLILTNQKVVVVQYHSLFSREVSQLNIAEVEDVNVAQSTLMDRVLKSGTITIETAGEQNNYTLTWVKDPYEFARLTIRAHEGSIAEYGN